MHAGNSGAFFWFCRCTQFFTPVGIAVGQHVDGGIGGNHVHRYTEGFPLDFLLYMLYVCVVTFQFFGFCFLESSHSLEHFVPIYQGSVKLGTVNADKLRLSADGQTTGSAHSGSVYHDGVE